MKAENHLDALAIERAAAGQVTREVDLHLGQCAVCRARVARGVRLERALEAMPRVEPAPGLSSRISAAVAARQAAEVNVAKPRRPKPYALAAALGAAFGTLLTLALVYEAGIELAANGALSFILFFVRRPDVVLAYPGDSFAAIVELLPLPQLLITFGLVVLVLMLVRSFRTAFVVAPTRGSNHNT